MEIVLYRDGFLGILDIYRGGMMNEADAGY